MYLKKLIFPFSPTSGEFSKDYSALLFYFALLWGLTYMYMAAE